MDAQYINCPSGIAELPCWCEYADAACEHTMNNTCAATCGHRTTCAAIPAEYRRDCPAAGAIYNFTYTGSYSTVPFYMFHCPAYQLAAALVRNYAFPPAEKFGRLNTTAPWEV